jgi:aldose sugar dehydrogenase
MRITSVVIATWLVVAAAVPGSTAAQQVIDARISSEYQNFRLVRVAGGFERPWAVAFLPDGRMLVTERPGRLQLLDGGTRTQVSGLPSIHAQGQGGLLDVVLHPDYGANGWLYLTYSRGDSAGTTTALARARLEGSSLVGLEELFVADAIDAPARHYGSRIVFLEDGTLLMTVGDRGHNPERGQNTQDHAATVLRLTADGGVPADNPQRDGVRPEIWAHGLRNIQGMAYHPLRREVWAADHGPRGSDELHIIEPGRNYGWPVVSLGREYPTQQPFAERREMAGVEQPALEFYATLAPSGMAVVHGGDWDERWQGNLLVGGLRAERVMRLVIEDRTVVHAEELLLARIGRIRDVRHAPDGFIYVVTDAEDGGVYRIEPVD